MSAAAVGDRLKRSVAHANASAAKVCRRSRTLSQIGLVHESSARITSPAGSRTGSGFSARLFRIEKSAVTPPIPSASDSTANAVTSGRGAQRAPDEGGRPDVEPARRLGGEDKPRLVVDLAREDHLLGVAAGERTRFLCG